MPNGSLLPWVTRFFDDGGHEAFREADGLATITALLSNQLSSMRSIGSIAPTLQRIFTSLLNVFDGRPALVEKFIGLGGHQLSELGSKSEAGGFGAAFRCTQTIGDRKSSAFHLTTS